MSINDHDHPIAIGSQLRHLAARIQDVMLSQRRPLRWGLVLGLIAMLWAISLPNQYISESRILPADQRASGGFAATAAAIGMNIPGQESPDAGLVDILNSRSLRESLLQTRFTFHARSWYFGSDQSKDQTLYEYLDVKNLDRAVGALKKRLSIVRDMKTKMITIKVETNSAELSQKVAMRAVELLDDFVVRKAQTRGGTKAAFSVKRLAEARLDLVRAEDAFQGFIESNRNFLMSPDPSVRMKGLRLDNELKLRSQLVTTLAIAHEQALLEEKNDMPILNILDAGNLPYEKHGPPRAIIVIVGWLVGLLGCWSLRNWSWIEGRLSSPGRKPSNNQDSDAAKVQA